MIIRQDLFVANGSVGGAAGAIVAGCQNITPARTGAGVYTLTFAAGDGVDEAESVILLTPRTDPTADRYGFSVHTSDIVKTITWSDGVAAASDTSFDFLIMKTGNTN